MSVVPSLDNFKTFSREVESGLPCLGNARKLYSMSLSVANSVCRAATAVMAPISTACTASTT